MYGAMLVKILNGKIDIKYIGAIYIKCIPNDD